VAVADTPHFSFPFRLEGGRVAVVEQGTDEHVESCEHVIVACPVGFRDERPEFGWPFPEFVTIPVSTGGIEQALRQFEPRSTARGHEYADAANAAIRHMRVEVS
jgi:phage baseplate assembly protein W